MSSLFFRFLSAAGKNRADLAVELRSGGFASKTPEKSVGSRGQPDPRDFSRSRSVEVSERSV